MEIKEPKFKVGDKVITKKGHVGNVIKVDSYHFVEDEYWYDVSCDEVDAGFYTEHYLEPYVEKPKTVWDLKKGDRCFFVTSAGNILDWYWDEEPTKIGNCFLTKEEAEFEIERRKVETEMLRLGGRRKFNRGKDNYLIMYDHVEGLNYLNYHSMHMQDSIYFDTESDVIDVVQTIGADRIKKYIFVE